MRGRVSAGSFIVHFVNGCTCWAAVILCIVKVQWWISLLIGLAIYLARLCEVGWVSTWLSLMIRSPSEVEYFLRPSRRPFEHYEITDRIRIGRMPRHKEDIDALRKLEVTNIISVCEEWELFPDVIQLCSFFHISVTDFTAPTIYQLLDACDYAETVGPNAKFYVHSNAGRGRAACVAAALLILFEDAPTAEDAIALVQKQCPLVNPRKANCWRHFNNFATLYMAVRAKLQ
eukprot:GEMP01058045.1.p1 GENE.GEMP01058045.1~~GEMP01058045.1.p1  ORF type:complete len:231 (+),score=31.60 GEMP01058045.1:168-860(+)